MSQLQPLLIITWIYISIHLGGKSVLDFVTSISRNLVFAEEIRDGK